MRLAGFQRLPERVQIRTQAVALRQNLSQFDFQRLARRQVFKRYPVKFRLPLRFHSQLIGLQTGQQGSGVGHPLLGIHALALSPNDVFLRGHQVGTDSLELIHQLCAFLLHGRNLSVPAFNDAKDPLMGRIQRIVHSVGDGLTRFEAGGEVAGRFHPQKHLIQRPLQLTEAPV